VKRATSDYLSDEDSIAAWLTECCEIGPAFSESPARLYASWKVYAERAGEIVGSLKAFGPKLEARGFGPPRRSSGKRFYEGVRVKPEAQSSQHWTD
jgi:putative DNA primase/helicase